MIWWIILATLAVDFVSSANWTESFISYNLCGCKNEFNFGIGDYIDDVIEGNAAYYLCCAKFYLEDQPMNFTVSWSFAKNSSTTFTKIKGCNGQKYSSRDVALSDEGNHTCTVTGANGTIMRTTVHLRVRKAPCHLKYVGKNITKTVFALHGETKFLECFFSMPCNASDRNILWRFREDRDHREQDALLMKNVELTEERKWGNILSSKLTLKDISNTHFGIYYCILHSSSDVTNQTVSVKHGEHFHVTDERRLKFVTSITIVLAIVLLFSSCIAYKLRLDIIQKLRKVSGNRKNKSAYKAVLATFEHDVFVMHGPSSTFWVYGTLLNFLEDQWSYNCFLPNRDIYAGEETFETISKHIEKSRRVLIVISECLLTSKWCAFLMFQAIQNALHSSSKIFAVTLTDVSKIEGLSLEIRNMLQIFECIKQIKYPSNILPAKEETCVQCDDEIENNLDSRFHTQQQPVINVEIECLENIVAQPTTNCQSLSYSKSSPNMTFEAVESLINSDHLPRSFSTDNNLQANTISLPPLTFNQRISNMISSNTNLENKLMCPKRSALSLMHVSRPTINQFFEKNLQKLKEELAVSREIEYVPSTAALEEQQKNSIKRKVLNSESSEAPLTLSYDVACNEAVMERIKHKNIFRRLDQSLFGSPEDKFWKLLHIHLPTTPLQELQQTNLQSLEKNP